MKLKMFAVKDTVQGEMMNPFLLKNKEDAIRTFEICVNAGKDSNICHFYKDMQLYEVGEYDTNTGEIKSEINFICNGVDVKKEK